MRKWLYILLALLPVVSCVGQKDDPLPDPGPEPIPDVPGGADEGKDAFRRSLVLDFTGTWCVNCPKMTAAIDELMTSRPGRIVPVAVHCMSIDPMYVKPASDDLIQQFDVKAYPSAVVDLDPESLVTQSSPELLQAHVDRLLEARGPAACIRILSAGEGEAPSVTVEARLVREGNYTLALLFLEDGIVASQTGGTTDYVHNHVLRQWHGSELFPDRKEGDVISFKWEGELPEKGRLTALVCRDGLVDNVTQCAAGASADFEYEEENKQ